MLINKTLFVVGAGASKELGFPLGSELLEELKSITRLKSDQTGGFGIATDFRGVVNEAAAKNWFTLEVANQKVAHLNTKLRGPVKSIDNLVNNYREDTELAKVAKLAIAYSISNCEASSQLKITDGKPLCMCDWPNNNWLFEFATHYFADFNANKLDDLFGDVAFTSFNYDRCVEYGLMRLAAFHFHLDDSRAFSLLDQIKIIHPYGSLGELPRSRPALNEIFGSSELQSPTVSMAQTIRTFSEGVEQDEVQNKIRDAIHFASTIVFLGFGFNPMNVDLLVNTSGFNKKVLGTAKGMSVQNTKASEEAVASRLKFASSFVDMSATEFIDRHAMVLFK